MHDLIGDIHGHAGALLKPLRLLGCAKQDGVYSHPESTLRDFGAIERSMSR